MPFKAQRRASPSHPQQTHKVSNWAAYNASPRQRGSLTLWFSEEAIAGWRAAEQTNTRWPGLVFAAGDLDMPSETVLRQARAAILHWRGCVYPGRTDAMPLRFTEEARASLPGWRSEQIITG